MLTKTTFDMKRVTIFLLLAGFLLAGFTACENKKRVHGDPWEAMYPPDIITNYTYINNSSNTIFVTNFSRDIASNERRREEFTIQKNKQHEIEYKNLEDLQRPFTLFPYRNSSYDQVDVSNGEVVVIQRSQNFSDTPDELFDVNKYVKTEEIIEENNGKHITRYTYTFTDDFFKDGEPVKK